MGTANLGAFFRGGKKWGEPKMYRQQNFPLSHWPGDMGTSENRFASLTLNPRYNTLNPVREVLLRRS